MRILFAWEMGKNYGHVTQIADIASLLARKKGMEIFIALQNPSAGALFLKEKNFKILQAPFHPVRPGGPRVKPLIYSDDLLPCGYDTADNLYPLIACWKSLYDLVKPHLLVAQAAPTALLAARGGGFARAAMGRSYDMPPLTKPFMPLRHWEKNDTRETARREDAMLETVNIALKRAGMKPLKHLSDMLAADRQFLCTFRELDHYPDRPKTDYYGPFTTTNTGFDIKWRSNAQNRILAYIRPGPPAFDACLRALRNAPTGYGYDIIVAAPGLPDDACVKLSTPDLRVVNKAVRLDKLLPDCDLGISYASAGMSSTLALAGIPSLMFPQHIEQLMFARSMARQKFGVILGVKPEPAQIAAAIKHILTTPEYRESTRALARKYESMEDDRVEQIAKELTDLARHRKGSK